MPSPDRSPQPDAGSPSAKAWRTVRIDVLEKIDRLPSLNTVVHEFLDLSQKEYFSAADFETIICKDQALVARLLKVANSGLYGRSRTIHSIAEAVVLIGLENLKKIVYAVSTEGLTKQQLAHYQYHAEGGFWLHSMGVALTARVFAEAAGAGDLRPEEAFVAGLLHDVAKLIIDEYLEARPGETVTLAMEIDAVGLDHAELAEHILKQWNLPASITDAVRHHHALAGGECPTGGAVLGLAEGVCDIWGVGRKHPLNLSEDAPVEPFRPALKQLGISESRWDPLIWDIRQHLAGCEDLYRMEP
jgi:putative nucleotidyltransferase with HDIG domain